jgi:hypothetical protein
MSVQASPFSVEDTNRILGVMLSEIQSLRMTDAQQAVAAAGIIVTAQYWHPFRTQVNDAFQQMTVDDRLIALRILGGHLSGNERVRTLLAQHGFEYVDGTFVPTAILDQREARYLPPSSAAELAKAMKRLVDGDETGAITSACGAVDTLMQRVYATAGLGEPGNASFSTKVNTAASRLGIFDDMASEFLAIGMKSDDVSSIVTHMQKATNHAAQMLQILRRSMGEARQAFPTVDVSRREVETDQSHVGVLS